MTPGTQVFSKCQFAVVVERFLERILGMFLFWEVVSCPPLAISPGKRAPEGEESP